MAPVTASDFGRLVGVLYGLNTLGAVVGVLASGFVLIGAVGETFTVFLGVLLNLAVGATAGLLVLCGARTFRNQPPSCPWPGKQPGAKPCRSLSGWGPAGPGPVLCRQWFRGLGE